MASPLHWSKLSSRCKICSCDCGRLVVFLRRSDWTPERPIWVICYLKSWDGNPWYNPSTHVKHPKKRFANGMTNLNGIPDPDLEYPHIKD